MATSINLTPGDLVSNHRGRDLTRHNFPDDFLFGAATSAYQVEGGYDEGRRGMSNWDAWSLEKPGKISDGGNGCVAIDHYKYFKEDVAVMKRLGIDNYRFSISWSRILPGGKLSNGVNREGVKFYNDLIDLLVAAGIQPFVTIFHFDVPLSLEREHGGFLDRRILKHFAEYAEVCFSEFGDRVKFWVTVNEASTFTTLGYITGDFPPGHGSPSVELLRSSNDGVAIYRSAPGVDRTTYGGDAATEPYIVAHNLILAHAIAVDIYRTKYQAVQGGKIGMVNAINWYVPYSKQQEDIDATNRAIDFVLGWFVEPTVTGDYPQVMRDRVGDRLPRFTPEEKKLVQGSYDFLGLNYYTSNWCAYNPKQPGDPTNYYTDQEVRFPRLKHGHPIGPPAGSPWLYVVPVGIYNLLSHVKNRYNDPVIYITENGVDEINNKKLPVSDLLEDDRRIDYHQRHLAFVRQAMDEGVNVKGYTVWALFDNYEWAAGYTVRFGMYYVDYANGLTRYPKKSVTWYMNFLNKKIVPGPKRQVEEVKEDTPAVKRKRNQ